MWRRAGSHAAMIFSKTDIAHIKHAVLDTPMAAHQFQQIVRAGLVPSQGRDAVNNRGARLSVTGSTTRQFECLCEEGPIQIGIQTRAADERALFDAAVPFIAARCTLAFCARQASFPRGKFSCLRMPVPAPHAVPFGFLLPANSNRPLF